MNLGYWPGTGPSVCPYTASHRYRSVRPATAEAPRTEPALAPGILESLGESLAPDSASEGWLPILADETAN